MSRLQLRRDGATLEVLLNRPPHNRIDGTTLDELEAVLDRAEGDSDLRVLLFHGGSLPFGTGIDLEAVSAALAEGVPPEPFVRRAHQVFSRLDALGLVTIGMLGGLCLGGALELALCLDVRIAETGTRLGLPELRLGLVPGFGGVARLTRLCGHGLARELLITGRTLSARRAYERGLVEHRVPRGEGLQAARALASSCGGLDRDVLAAAKNLLVPELESALERERQVLLERLAAAQTPTLIQQTLDRSDAWKLLPSNI